MRPTRPYTLACRCSYLWFAALVLLTVPGVAQQDSTNVRIHMLIEDDLDRHVPTIRQLTSGMTPEERMELYEKHKERAAGPFVLNMMWRTRLCRYGVFVHTGRHDHGWYHLLGCLDL